MNNSVSELTIPDTFIGRHLINGAWCESESDEWSERISPSHGVVVSKVSKGGASETNRAIESARSAFDSGCWNGLSGKERGAVLLEVADLIEANVERIALLESLESGKPITQSRGEVSGAADMWRYAASLARTSTGDSHNSLGDDMVGVVLKQPIGVVSIITPWNFPFWILNQKLPFALAAGCTTVVKPSEFTPSSTVMMGELLIEAGLPAGVCNIVLGYGQPVGSLMASHGSVDMVTFTGSTAVGKSITETSAVTLKKVALELGGKNAQVIFPNANLEDAADAVVFGVYFNAGQCCNSSSRLILHEDIAVPFIETIIELSKKVVFGNPLNPATQVGAIVTDEHIKKIHQYVKKAEAEGATIALGGDVLSVDGLSTQFYQPTIMVDITNEMSIASDEVFGPVLTVQTFKTLEEAIELTNATKYGLSAGVWSDDIHTCLEYVRGVDVGTVWTNTWMDGFPEMAFGGMKESGQGREIGQYGFDEFLEVKSVVMRVGHTRSAWVDSRDY